MRLSFKLKKHCANACVACALVLFFLASASFVFHYCGVAAAKIWKPKLVCDEVAYHFGEVVAPSSVSKEFVFRNKGSRDLVIERVSAGCGSCVRVTDYTNQPIKAKKTGVVVLTLLTDNLRGTVSQVVRVQTNDPKQPDLILTLSAEVVRPECETDSMLGEPDLEESVILVPANDHNEVNRE